MEYLFVSIAFFAGVAIGLSFQRIKRSRAANKVLIDVDTFQYLTERDNELWQLEKIERSKPRYISPQLAESGELQTSLN